MFDSLCLLLKVVKVKYDLIIILWINNESAASGKSAQVPPAYVCLSSLKCTKNFWVWGQRLGLPGPLAGLRGAYTYSNGREKMGVKEKEEGARQQILARGRIYTVAPLRFSPKGHTRLLRELQHLLTSFSHYLPPIATCMASGLHRNVWTNSLEYYAQYRT